MISYLAAPYSNPDKRVIEANMQLFCRVDAFLIKQGIMTVTPLSKHFILEHQALPGDWKYWENYSKELLKVCGELIVVMIPGWETSTGVTEEIKFAKALGIPVRYFNHISMEFVETVKWVQ